MEKPAFNRGEVVVDYQNRLHQIVIVPDDYHEQLLCNDLQTGKRTMLWQYGLQRSSKYIALSEGNTVMYYENAASSGVKVKIVIMRGSCCFVTN
jgi:hypothetical protein